MTLTPMPKARTNTVTAGDVVFYMASAVIIGTLWMVILNDTPDRPDMPLIPLETITRFERTINGERVRCERREDHVRGTTETAC